MDINKEINKEIKNEQNFKEVEQKNYKDDVDLMMGNRVKGITNQYEQEAVKENNKEELNEVIKMDSEKQIKYFDTNSLLEKDGKQISETLLDKHQKERIKKNKDLFNKYETKKYEKRDYKGFAEANEIQIKVMKNLFEEISADKDTASESYEQIKSCLKTFIGLNKLVNNKSCEIEDLVEIKDFRNKYKEAYYNLKNAINNYLGTHSFPRFSRKGRRRKSFVIRCGQELAKMKEFGNPFLAGLKELDNLRDCIRDGSINEECIKETNDLIEYSTQNGEDIQQLHKDLFSDDYKTVVKAILTVYKKDFMGSKYGNVDIKKYYQETILINSVFRAINRIDRLPFNMQAKFSKEFAMIQHGVSILVADKYKNESKVKEKEDIYGSELTNNYAKAKLVTSDLMHYQDIRSAISIPIGTHDTNMYNFVGRYIFTSRQYNEDDKEISPQDNDLKYSGVQDFLESERKSFDYKNYLSNEELNEFNTRENNYKNETMNSRHYIPINLKKLSDLMDELERDEDSKTDAFKDVVKNVTTFYYSADHRELERMKNHSAEYNKLYNAALKSLNQYNSKHKSYRFTEKGVRRRDLVQKLLDEFMNLDIQNFEVVENISVYDDLDRFDSLSVEEKSLYCKKDLYIKDKMSPLGSGLGAYLPIKHIDKKDFTKEDAFNYNFNTLLNNLPISSELTEVDEEVVQAIPEYIINMKFDENIMHRNYGIVNPQFFTCMKSFLEMADFYKGKFKFPNKEYKTVYNEKVEIIRKYMDIISKNMADMGINVSNGEILEKPLDNDTIEYDKRRIETLKEEIASHKFNILNTKVSKTEYNKDNSLLYSDLKSYRKINSRVDENAMKCIKICLERSNDIKNLYLNNSFSINDLINTESGKKRLNTVEMPLINHKDKAGELVKKFKMKSFDRSLGYFLGGYKTNIFGVPIDKENRELKEEKESIMDAYLNDDMSVIKPFFDKCMDKLLGLNVDFVIPEKIKTTKDAEDIADLISVSQLCLIYSEFLQLPANKGLFEGLSKEKQEFIRNKTEYMGARIMYEVNSMLKMSGLGVNNPFILEESKTNGAEKDYENFVKMKNDLFKPFKDKYLKAKEEYEKSLNKN